MRHFAKGAERRWYLTVDTASGSAGEYVPTPVTGTGSTLAAGQAFFINTTAAVADSTLPASPQTGDFVIIVDFSKTFDSKPFTMKRAASGERIDGLAADYVHNHRGMAAKWVYSGDVTKGWVMESCANMWLPSIATTKAAATTHDLSFIGDSRTCTITTAWHYLDRPTPTTWIGPCPNCGTQNYATTNTTQCECGTQINPDHTRELMLNKLTKLWLPLDQAAQAHQTLTGKPITHVAIVKRAQRHQIKTRLNTDTGILEYSIQDLTKGQTK
jgi:hypothetical protein